MLQSSMNIGKSVLCRTGDCLGLRLFDAAYDCVSKHLIISNIIQ